jgi:hypothetical protein
MSSGKTFKTNIILRGFPAELDAPIRDMLGLVIRELASILNLEKLDGITIATDYEEALIQLDRGFDASHPLSRTDDVIAQGIAMTPAVVRNGTVKAHVVLAASVVAPLLKSPTTDDDVGFTIHTIAHELAHVHDLAFRDRAMPNVILKHRTTHWDEFCLFDIADACWQEYAACRLSAPFGLDPATGYIEVFLCHLQAAKSAADKAILNYRSHGDLVPTATEVARCHGNLMKFASYVIGHFDGLGAPISERFPDCSRSIRESYFSNAFEELSHELNRLWMQKEYWDGLNSFDGLTGVVRKHLANSGMVFMRTDRNEVYIAFPF